MTAVLLALGTALCYGLSNFIGPLISRELPTTAVLVGGQFVALTVSAIVVVATAAPAPPLEDIGAGLLAGAGNAGGLFFFYAAASSGPLSIVTPIGSVGAAVPVLIGVATGDALGVAGAAGIVLAIGGVALAARRRSADASEAKHLRRTVALASLGAVGFGVFLTALKPASSEGVFWGVLVSRVSLLVLLVGAALIARNTVRVSPRDLPKVALPGLLLFAGTMLYASATRHGLLSVVSAIGSLNPVVTVTLALVFLHERLARVQWVGVGAALTGVVLLSV